MPWLLVFAAIAFLPLLILGVFGLGSRFKRDPYPPEAADGPDADGDFIAARAQPFTGEKLPGVPYVASGHRRCGGPCCAEEQIEELMIDFDWHGHEREFRRVA